MTFCVFFVLYFIFLCFFIFAHHNKLAKLCHLILRPSCFGDKVKYVPTTIEIGTSTLFIRTSKFDEAGCSQFFGNFYPHLFLNFESINVNFSDHVCKTQCFICLSKSFFAAFAAL